MITAATPRAFAIETRWRQYVNNACRSPGEPPIAPQASDSKSRASSCTRPPDSTAIGTNSSPCRCTRSSQSPIFLAAPRSAAWPGVLAAEFTTSAFVGRHVIKSMNTSLPPTPRKIMMSGRLLESPMNPLYVGTPKAAWRGWAAQAAPSPPDAGLPARSDTGSSPPRLRGHGEPPGARGRARVVARRPSRPGVEVGAMVEAALDWGRARACSPS